MHYAAMLFTIAGIQLLAAASPGPTFLVVSRYSVIGSRQRALQVVLGVMFADFTWASLSACGISAVIGRYPAIHYIFQIGGAVYLIWLGVKILLGLRHDAETRPLSSQIAIPSSSRWAIRDGFLTNMANPKSVAYYTSLFVIVIPVHAPAWLLAATIGTALFVSAMWWLGVVFFFGLLHVRKAYEAIRRYIEATMGCALIILGIRLGLIR